MRLTELRPQWLKVIDERHFDHVHTLAEADGVIFLCPLCMQKNHMQSRGVHSVICWRPNVPQTISPVPGRWDFRGSDYNTLTLVAGSSSVLITDGCKAHFHITDGIITYC